MKSKKVGSKLYSKGTEREVESSCANLGQQKKAKLPSSFTESRKLMSAFWRLIGAKVNNRRVAPPTGTAGEQLFCIRADVECTWKSLNLLARRARTLHLPRAEEEFLRRHA